MPGSWAIHSARSFGRSARRKPNGKQSISDSIVPGRTPSASRKRRTRSGYRFGERISTPPTAERNGHGRSMVNLFSIRHALRPSADRQFRNGISMRFPPLRQTDVQSSSIRMAKPTAKPNPMEYPHAFHVPGQVASKQSPRNHPGRDPAGVYGISKSFPVHIQGASTHSAKRRPILRPGKFQRAGQCKSRPTTHAWPSDVRSATKAFPGSFRLVGLLSSTARPGHGQEPGQPISTSRPSHVQA
jgi:hypothetical protein